MANWLYASPRTTNNDGWLYGSSTVTGVVIYNVSVAEGLTLTDIIAIFAEEGPEIIEVSINEGIALVDFVNSLTLEHEANIRHVLLINPF